MALAVSGVCPVLETPFTGTGEVDEPSFVRLIESVHAAGIRQVMYPGYASEFLKLTDLERATMTDVLLDAGRHLGGLEVIVSIPDHSAQVAVPRAEYAAQRGAHAINILPPYLLGPSPDAVRAHIIAVAAAVSELPVIVQYAPAQTGAALSATELAQLAKDAPNIVAVKVEAVPPGRLISALAHGTPPLASAVGYGGLQLIDALERGAIAVQPGSSFVELYLDVWNAWERGEHDFAREMHGRLLPYLSYWMQGVELIIAAEKRISMLRGLIESDVCRAPARALDAVELAQIDRFLSEFGGRLEMSSTRGATT